VVLDESPENFDLFVSWLFHRPDFTVTAGHSIILNMELTLSDNVETLLELSQKYDVPKLGQDIGVFSLNPFVADLQHILMASVIPTITPEISYVLGASFDVAILEERYRSHVVHNFGNFVRLEKYFNMLVLVVDQFQESVPRARKGNKPRNHIGRLYFP